MKIRNVFKRTNKILFAFLALFGFILQTNAASASLNFTRVNWQDKTSQSLPFSPGETFHIKYVTGTTTYAYCNDYPYKTPQGVQYNLVEEITDPGKVYILSQGPTTEENNNYLDYYVTQVAYWIYDLEQRGGGDPTRDSSVRYLQTQINNAASSNATAKKIRNLVDEAKKQTAESGVTLSTNTNTLTFTLSSDGKYYVSNDVKVSSNGNYSVTVNGPTGTIKEDISGGFRVKVPVSSVNGSVSVSATVTGTKNVNHAYLYKAPNKASDGREYQAMAMLSVEASTKTASLSGNITVTTKVSISKIDATTGEELPGAHLELRDENGNLIVAWVSGEEPHPIEELKPGKYTLTEVLAPEGYETSTETVEFTVNEDGSVDGMVVMLNKPETIVEVPSTSSFKTIATSLIGIIVIGLGSVIVYRNYKKNEEI